MKLERLDADRLNRWIRAEPGRAALMQKKARISRATLQNCRHGYQPHQHTIARINEVMAAYPNATHSDSEGPGAA